MKYYSLKYKKDLEQVLTKTYAQGSGFKKALKQNTDAVAKWWKNRYASEAPFFKQQSFTFGRYQKSRFYKVGQRAAYRVVRPKRYQSGKWLNTSSIVHPRTSGKKNAAPVWWLDQGTKERFYKGRSRGKINKTGFMRKIYRAGNGSAEANLQSRVSSSIQAFLPTAKRRK